MAYKVDSLWEANDALRAWIGPWGLDHLEKKKKKISQEESAVSKHNLHVSSMSGKFILVNY